MESLPTHEEIKNIIHENKTLNRRLDRMTKEMKHLADLSERATKLSEYWLDQIKRKSTSLEQSNRLFAALIHYVPQQIFVMRADNFEILLTNEVASSELNKDTAYLETIIHNIGYKQNQNQEYNIEINYVRGGQNRYLLIKSYIIEWNSIDACIFVITDITVTKTTIEDLHTHAYKDSLTKLHNRAFGMLTLDKWLHECKRFVLVFADLDSLKYINDKFGHKEGDAYIICAAKHLRTFSPDAVVCRLGGDEFMLLAQETDYNEVQTSMEHISKLLQNDPYLNGKDFMYSISFGIVAVEADNKLHAGDLLSIADEHMYEHKRMRKKMRANEY